MRQASYSSSSGHFFGPKWFAGVGLGSDWRLRGARSEHRDFVRTHTPKAHPKAIKGTVIGLIVSLPLWLIIGTTVEILIH